MVRNIDLPAPPLPEVIAGVAFTVKKPESRMNERIINVKRATSASKPKWPF